MGYPLPSYLVVLCYATKVTGFSPIHSMYYVLSTYGPYHLNLQWNNYIFMEQFNSIVLFASKWSLKYFFKKVVQTIWIFSIMFDFRLRWSGPIYFPHKVVIQRENKKVDKWWHSLCIFMPGYLTKKDNEITTIKVSFLQLWQEGVHRISKGVTLLM